MEQVRRIVAHVGKEFTIELEANPTTGYSWEPQLDKNGVELVKSSYTPSKTSRLGGGGKQTFNFLPRKKGEVMIRMRYRRPWGGSTPKETLYSVNVVE